MPKKITNKKDKDNPQSKIIKLISKFVFIKGEMTIVKNKIALGLERLINKPLK